MLTSSVTSRHICVAILFVFVFGGICFADWHTPIWTDEFAGGTTDQTWVPFSGGGMGNYAVTDLGGGNWGYHLSAPNLGASYGSVGWAGAYVDVIAGDQGMTGWVDTSLMGIDNSAALSFLRYTPTALPGQGFGSGYALAVTYNSGGQITTSIRQIAETGESLIGDEVAVLSDYSDVWFRFLATGTDADTRLRARVWADGTPEPDDWLLDVGVAGNYSNTGRGGIGVVTMTTDLPIAEATFDNIAYGTPEPTSMVLLATGLGALVLRRRRNKA